MIKLFHGDADVSDGLRATPTAAPRANSLQHYVDQASEAASEAMKLAEELSHPHTLVFTICHARGFMDLFWRRCEDTSSYAGLVISICKENRFLHWVNCGVVLDGWAAVNRGQLDRVWRCFRKAWSDGRKRELGYGCRCSSCWKRSLTSKQAVMKPR